MEKTINVRKSIFLLACAAFLICFSVVPAKAQDYASGRFAAFSSATPTLSLDDPFYYLSGGADKMVNDDETKNFVASWYQVLWYASISGTVITGLACIIVWSVTPDGNKRAEKRRALMRKGVLLVCIGSLSWILSVLFEILSRLR